MKVLFLISDGFGIGGTIRTTFNLAEALAARGHDVEVLSMFRRHDTPQLPLHPAVRLMSLLEARPDHPDFDATDPLRGRPAVVYPRDDYRSGQYDRLVEDRAARYLHHSDADVVIGTRPGLIAFVSRLAPDRMVRIGQEHLTRSMHRKGLRAVMGRHYRRLDAFVTVSAHDAEDYRAHLRLPHTRLLFIPNGVPAPRVPVSDGRHHIVAAAGRLVANKRYDVLIRAFATVVKTHPHWQLRLYGGGDRRADLRRLIVELGLHNHVLLMGSFTPIEPEWAKAAIAAVPSDKEPFGMTIVEAMRCGLPVVSTDAPYGPAEIIRDGVDGVLTPVGDPSAMAAALLDLIEDPRRRAGMAAAAQRNAARYDPAPVAERYEKLFEELAQEKARRPMSWRKRLATVALRTVGPDRLTLRRPGLERPGLEPPSLEPPSLERPGLELPGVGRPAVSSPGLDVPSADRSAGAARTLDRPRLDRLVFGLSGGAVGGRRRPAPVLGPARQSADPVADCTVSATGDLTLRLSAALLPRDAVLGWHRVGKGSPRSVAVAPPVRSGDTATATVGMQDVPPGSWELRISAGAATIPVAAGLRDTRALVNGRQSPDGGVHVRMPYRSSAGSLQVRVWRRPVHPEIGEIYVDGTEIRFDGRLLGAPFRTRAPRLELRCRVPGGPAEHTAVHLLDDSSFHVVLPAGLPAAHRTAAAEDLWDLWLQYDDSAAPVRPGRLLDDVVDKRSAYIYPDVVLRRADRGDARVQPYYTMHNDLSVRVTDPPT